MSAEAVEMIPMKWSEREIARSLYLNVFNGKHLVAVPNCSWTGHECDLLVVRADLRIVDVEIKISRSDLKADAKKEKWLKRYRPEPGEPWRPWNEGPFEKLEHPEKVWKHYYALPQEIWTPSLAESISPASGILLIRDAKTRPMLRVERQAKPNKDAGKISAEALCHIARLCTVRMWDSYNEVDVHRRERSRNQTGGGTK